MFATAVANTSPRLEDDDSVGPAAFGVGAEPSERGGIQAGEVVVEGLHVGVSFEGSTPGSCDEVCDLDGLRGGGVGVVDGWVQWEPPGGDVASDAVACVGVEVVA